MDYSDIPLLACSQCGRAITVKDGERFEILHSGNPVYVEQLFGPPKHAGWAVESPTVLCGTCMAPD